MGLFANEASTATITLVDGQREYTLATDEVFERFAGQTEGTRVLRGATTGLIVTEYPGGYAQMLVDQPVATDYTGDPSVDGRREAFRDAAEKLLWPDRRDDEASIWRTQRESVLQVPLDYLPGPAQAAARRAGVVVEAENGVRYARIGPVPTGTSINLLANLDLSLGALSDFDKVVKLIQLARAIRKTLHEVEEQRPEGEELFTLMKESLLPLLLDNSNCPDLVEDRGHYFGTQLPDENNLALIELRETF